jgi:peptide/nickel transport system substrate-binding protein
MQVSGITRGLATAAIASLFAAAIVGCGGSSSDAPTGTLRVTYASFPDYLDPALSYSLEGGNAMYDVYLPLLTFAHASGKAGTRVVPALAKALPKVSDDGRTYTLFLRKGLRYSNGKPVRASDFKWQIERVFLLNSPGSPFYEDIVGAPRFAATKKGGIDGIQVDDGSGKIVIHLAEPRGTFEDELALLFAAPVPRSSPAKDMTADPPPATGPYEIVSVQQGRGWRYRPNPVWAAHNGPAVPQVPAGHVAAIEVKILRNPSTQVNQIIQGSSDWMQNPPSADRLPELERKYGDSQLRSYSQPSIFYFWMNTRRPPFDDLRVRRAVNYALDPRALERIYAGQMQASQQVLPPGIPGYRQFEPYPHDMRTAKRLMAKADPADRSVSVWTDSFGPNKEAGEYYQDVLSKLGFQAQLKVLSPDNYFTVIGNESTPELDTGWSNWLEDYPHPNDYFEPQLSPAGIRPTGGTNWARFASPPITAQIETLGGQQLGKAQEAAYAGLDRKVMAQAPWAPFGNLTLTVFVSSRVDADQLVFSPTYGVDLTSFQLK